LQPLPRCHASNLTASAVTCRVHGRQAGLSVMGALHTSPRRDTMPLLVGGELSSSRPGSGMIWVCTRGSV
jgi:hypothetical protein